MAIIVPEKRIFKNNLTEAAEVYRLSAYTPSVITKDPAVEKYMTMTVNKPYYFAGTKFTPKRASVVYAALFVFPTLIWLGVNNYKENYVTIKKRQHPVE